MRQKQPASCALPCRRPRMNSHADSFSEILTDLEIETLIHQEFRPPSLSRPLRLTQSRSGLGRGLVRDWVYLIYHLVYPSEARKHHTQQAQKDGASASCRSRAHHTRSHAIAAQEQLLRNSLCETPAETATAFHSALTEHFDHLGSMVPCQAVLCGDLGSTYSSCRGRRML